MIKKVSSVLGFACLFILGAPTNGYSDSLPANVGRLTNGGYEGCVTRGFGITNTCPYQVTVLLPAQSRAAGYWTFNATAQNSPDCYIYGEDYNGNNQFYGYARPNGRASLGRFYVYSNTVLFYACNLQQNQSVLSVDWTQ